MVPSWSCSIRHCSLASFYWQCLFTVLTKGSVCCCGMCVCVWIHNFFLNFEPFEISQTFLVSFLLPKFLCWRFISFPGGASDKEPASQCRICKRPGFCHCVGRSPVGGPRNTLQHCCQENSMDRGVWWATVHRVGHHWNDSMHTRNGQTSGTLWY